MITSYLVALVVIALVVISAVIDLRERRIPNAVTIPAIVTGIIFHTIAPWGLGWMFTLAGLGLGIVLLLIPYLLGGGGMGDIKLLAAVGAWLGPKWLLVAFASGILTGAVLTVICLLTGKSFEELIGLPAKKGNLSQSEPRGVKALRLRSRKSLPFAVPLALGTCFMLGVLLLRGGL